MNKIKLIVSDIDGTILNEKCECSTRVRRALDEAQKLGIKVVLATGRMFMGADPVRESLGLDTPVICYQGAMVRQGNDILYQNAVDNSLAREIIRISREYGFHLNLYNNDTLIVEDDNKQYMKDYTQGRFTTYEVVKSFDDVELGDVSKLLCITYNEDEIINLQKELSKQFEGKLAIVRSHKYYLEFTDIKATKGNAMNFLKDLWNIKTEEVFASGDQDNDYDLLKNAGVKIAMGNASEKLKSIADYICPTINEDGLADAIEKYVLNPAGVSGFYDKQNAFSTEGGK